MDVVAADDVLLEPAAIAYLRGGRFAAVVTALAALHRRGFVTTGRPGTVRRTERYDEEPGGFERVVLRALHGSVAPAGLTLRPPVERATADVRRQLRDARLIRPLLPVAWWSPARNHRGNEVLHLCGAEHPLERGKQLPALDPEDVAWQVALYGNEALLALLPAFARQGGMFDQNASDEMTGAEAGNPSSSPYAV